LRKDGTEFPVEIGLSPLETDTGILVTAAVRDITERRLLENSLVERVAELARADRSKDELLAMLAHELRNPLAPLRNAAEILNTADVSAEEHGEAQRILARQIENMSRMIDDLLDVSRITEGKIQMCPQVVALADILTAAANIARSGIASRGQSLEVSLPAEPIFLNADATRLEQVFGNLFTNASKYSDSGCPFRLSAERVAGRENEPPEVIVRVSDDGIGIAPELLPRIFDLFVQATRAPAREQGGLGIGLTLVHRLVKLHGGSVEARSEGLGRGSEFIVRLPILSGPPVTLRSTPAPPVRETPRRMLIVDDNEDSARSMATLQRRRGHEARAVFTGPDALVAAAEFMPEVVLLDIGLPGMDGFEVAQRLRAMPALAGAFLAAMSGYGSPEDVAHARAAGFDEYLVKPADLDLLRAWLRSRA
jgi:signal transduction histidine kinase